MEPIPAPPGSNALVFSSAIAEELDAMQLLLSLLGQERVSLAQGKADGLAELAAEKTEVVAVLLRCADQRARLLRNAGAAHGATGLEHILGSDQAARSIWSSLLDVAKRAAELNAGNSYLVDQQLARVDRAIVAIRGPRRLLYGSDGTTHFDAGASRSRAQA